MQALPFLSSCDLRLAGNHLLAPTPWADEQCWGDADGSQLLRLPDQQGRRGWGSRIVLRGEQAHQ